MIQVDFNILTRDTLWLGKGRVAVSWKVVSCPENIVSGPMAYLFKQGSTVDWWAVQIRNHRLPVDSVEVKNSAGLWQILERLPYNYFKPVNSQFYLKQISIILGWKCWKRSICVSHSFW